LFFYVEGRRKKHTPEKKQTLFLKFLNKYCRRHTYILKHFVFISTGKLLHHCENFFFPTLMPSVSHSHVTLGTPKFPLSPTYTHTINHYYLQPCLSLSHSSFDSRYSLHSAIRTHQTNSFTHHGFPHSHRSI